MKRCPQCNRVEPDDSLVYCRTDGVALVNDSSLDNDDPRTARLGSGAVATEIDTSLLPRRTHEQVGRSTGPTTALPHTSTGNTRELNKRGPRKVLIVASVTVVVVAIAIGGYFAVGKFVGSRK